MGFVEGEPNLGARDRINHELDDAPNRQEKARAVDQPHAAVGLRVVLAVDFCIHRQSVEMAGWC